MADYVELHAHSAYSFLDGASRPEELAARALELGYPALALTDHDGLYGSMEFAQFARAHGLQPITGAELTLASPFAAAGDVPAGTSGGRAPTERGAETGDCHVTVLAENAAGYANLCRLITQAHMESPRREPRLDLAALLERPEGLILLTGCRRSPLLAALERGTDEAERLAARLRDAFGPGNLFVELQNNAVHGDLARGRALGALADRLRIPVVATGNVHYHVADRHRLQDVMVAIRNRTTVDDSHELRRPNACFHLASPREMAWRFASRPDALRNTRAIAERCRAFDLTADLGYRFPDFRGSGFAPAMRVLHHACRGAFEIRYPPGSRYRREAEERLASELALVDRHDLAGFFLVYHDILELAREVAHRVRGDSMPRQLLPPGRGRGSSVSSIICYLIGLSHVDPVRTNLFLGRFLNDAMESVPDIDIDFARDIREELILAVYERYGYDHVGLVCTFPTYRTRSIVRELGKALSLPAGDVEKLAKLAEPGEDGFMAELERIPGLEARANSRIWRVFAELAGEIRGLPRHISQHVGGMIISSRPLVEIVPLEPAAWEGRVLCQWDKDSCDDARFIKIDFLALGMLSLVEEAVETIHLRHGEVPDLSRIDYEDEGIYDRICSGDTVGLFQVESRAQIQMLRRVRPRNLADLAVQVAIVRPGPIVGGAVNPYVRRREKLRNDPDYVVPYDHPLLEEALGETLGVIIFQDQVLQVCRALAGFSDGQAEGLRRAMSRKRSREALLGYWTAFRDGAAAKGVDGPTAKKVFEQVVAFSEFGFPKSHAVAFGLLAYQSAWLRDRYPPEYYVGLFNNQPMGFYSLDAIGRDARRHGVGVRLPDLNVSEVACTAEEGDVRIGLGMVRDWGAEAAELVVAERGRDGPFASLPDFLRRTPAALKRAAIENLIWVGGLDSLGIERRDLLWQTGLWLGPEAETETERRRRELATGAAGLGGDAPPPVRGRRGAGRSDQGQIELSLGDPYADLRFAGTHDMEKLIAEYRLLSFAASQHHPFALVGDHLPERTVSSSRFPDLPNRSDVRVAGIVVARQRPHTANGYIFILMEDEFGPVNAIVRPEVYRECRAAIRLEPFLYIDGTLQKDGATYNVLAGGVYPLRLSPELRPGRETVPAVEGEDETPFAYLEALRRDPPPTMSWGRGGGCR
ncbi:MAG: DNA polymerase III subunit alpha [Gemmatimonadota bacterium]|uniref:DNA polymerase III subunit alpha n=1 Tax=Candidatus Palauibacter scopulicola TaxID=3056741 RepID=UPI0023A3548B|nr:DNA polymerase III subunit alpha [Candidatus Palauibacter scopulicola]MDE2664456.1 DNA polymerase III subunit alpha [Candidatus Palauibacter scopulicola]